MKRRPSARRETFTFILIASFLMILADQFIFGGTRPYIEDLKEQSRQVQEETAQEQTQQMPQAAVTEVPIVEEAKPVLDYEPVFETSAGPIFTPDPDFEPPVVEEAPAEQEIPAFRAPQTGPAPKIAIIIDDIGMVLKGSRRALNLPAPMTLAFLPYAEATPELAAQARAKNHEVMLHMPMEAMTETVSLGGMGLKSNMDPAAFEARLDEILGAFEGYTGANNHMGSRLTQDSAAMAKVMAKLKEKNVFFVDSKTISSSVAAQEAARAGLAHATRDVFLDHEETPEFVAQALRKTERIALQSGSAIAIGHPKNVTLSALHQWIPDAQARGFEIVPVSALLKRPVVE